MIKDVLRMMWNMEADLHDLIRADIHLRTQVFIQDVLRDVTRHVTKKKRPRSKTWLEENSPLGGKAEFLTALCSPLPATTKGC